jgi:hypothetical protein
MQLQNFLGDVLVADAARRDRIENLARIDGMKVVEVLDRLQSWFAFSWDGFSPCRWSDSANEGGPGRSLCRQLSSRFERYSESLLRGSDSLRVSLRTGLLPFPSSRGLAPSGCHP